MLYFLRVCAMEILYKHYEVSHWLFYFFIVVLNLLCVIA